MAADTNDIIDKLKKEAIERCRERILQVPKKREGCVKRPEYRVKDHGMTTALKSRHGL